MVTIREIKVSYSAAYFSKGKGI